jgi:hypothetical protein
MYTLDALVAGYAPLALGTDIGGSVRLPAAYNGVFALKSSLGRHSGLLRWVRNDGQRFCRSVLHAW